MHTTKARTEKIVLNFFHSVINSPSVSVVTSEYMACLCLDETAIHKISITIPPQKE